jgi:3-oxoacyl-[acyl-carrier-protein] synthase-1
MLKVFTGPHNIVSPLGITTQDNFSAMLARHSGVQLHEQPGINDKPFWAAIIGKELMQALAAKLAQPESYTRFERMLIGSISDAVKGSAIDPADPQTIFIISTTKGNISLLEETDGDASGMQERISLPHSARLVAQYFNNPNTPLVVSNACISGALALLVAKRLLQGGQYKHAVVAGADTMSRFVFSGFQSFQALSAGSCKPFSADRDGINLGEAASTLLLTTDKSLLRKGHTAELKAGATSNDANHISGPSRTGEELSQAIREALQLSGISISQVDFISAHGTATLFNDEMEAKAFNLAGMQHKPVNSLKGYFGHTLGASGLLECVISLESLQQGIMIPTIGFTSLGVSQPIEVCSIVSRKSMKHFIKTASGFGGCNAALIFSKS